MGINTQGASVLDKPAIPKNASFKNVKVGFEGTWDYGLSHMTAGVPVSKVLLGPSKGSASLIAGLAKFSQGFYEDIDQKFNQLSLEWKRDTGHMSAASRIVSHPAYLKIIAMGEAAIPLILKDLAIEPNHWFSALSALAGDGPRISEHDRGNITKIAQAWLDWGRQNHYIN